MAATPAGERHEFGAMLAAVTAASEGWDVTYLGPDLPAEDIAAAARRREAQVVALSLVYSGAHPRFTDELRRLRHDLGAEVTLLAGGAAAAGYEEALRDIGALRIDDLRHLTRALRDLAAGAPA